MSKVTITFTDVPNSHKVLTSITSEPEAELTSFALKDLSPSQLAAFIAIKAVEDLKDETMIMDGKIEAIKKIYDGLSL